MNKRSQKTLLTVTGVCTTMMLAAFVITSQSSLLGQVTNGNSGKIDISQRMVVPKREATSNPKVDNVWFETIVRNVGKTQFDLAGSKVSYVNEADKSFAATLTIDSSNIQGGDTNLKPGKYARIYMKKSMFTFPSDQTFNTKLTFSFTENPLGIDVNPKNNTVRNMKMNLLPLKK